MDRSVWQQAAVRGSEQRLDWRKKISDHVAYALLVYTGLQIFVTMHALKTGHGSILPYFSIVLLVGAIIPACRMAERRWAVLDDAAAADPALQPAFRRDRALIWITAISLPVIITLVLLGLARLF